MLILFSLIPFLALASGIAIYHRTGRKEFLKFDVVQFVYAFILAPIMFIYLKSFIFFILRDELDLNLSLNGLFILDTVFSVIFMFIYAFLVIHSLTKSFENKRFVDPLYDVFKHSEVLHLWISHLIMFVGGMVLFTLVSLINLWFPLQIMIAKWQFYSVIGLGFITGSAGFGAIWLSVPDERFWKLIKLALGFFFVVHILIYFGFNLEFSSQYLIFWFCLTLFTAAVIWAFGLEKSERVMGWWEKLHHKIGWSAKKRKFLLSK